MEVRQTASVPDASGKHAMTSEYPISDTRRGRGRRYRSPVEIHADLILMDDREGVLMARSKGFRVTGTLGILSMAAGRCLGRVLSTLPRHLSSSKLTTFHCEQEIAASRKFMINCLATRQAHSSAIR